MATNQDIIRAHFAEIGRKGAQARWAKTTAEERSEYARKMAKASNAARLKKLETVIHADHVAKA